MRLVCRCPWQADFPEHKLDDYVQCLRPGCGKTTCRGCDKSIELDGQNSNSLQIASHKEARKINERNELIAHTHLISCALELRIEEVCARGLTVPCPQVASLFAVFFIQAFDCSSFMLFSAESALKRTTRARTWYGKT